MNYERGKIIFFDNFGSKDFMSRNGELSEYQKCRINKDDEEAWKNDILNDIIQKVITEQDIGLIWNLSCMDISNDRKISAYLEIKKRGNKERIRKTIKELKNLFNEKTFYALLEIFN